jgi:hypothetical protein
MVRATCVNGCALHKQQHNSSSWVTQHASTAAQAGAEQHDAGAAVQLSSMM